MTEQEWLESEDPQAMLTFLINGPATPEGYLRKNWQRPSARKLRLFSFACGERCGKSNISKLVSVMEPMPWAMRWANPDSPSWIEGPNRITQKEKADILRDIVSNPFRPVTLPLNHITGRTQATGYFPDGIPIGECSWLTPTVLAIAQAAYEDRLGRKCERCSNGTLMIGALPSHWKKCPTCHGTGRIEDGTLDPVTLTILADAIEDAGCDSEYILMHLRGKQQCDCEGSYDAYTRGCDCNGSGWKTMEGHHVRGCHVLDIILGKE